MRAIALQLIRLYQVLTPPALRGACRHYPTCSEYAREAIARHGVWRGSRLALARLGRCHPLGSAGYDPVP
jgi:putative membrane protein insertion efficiency factor